MAKEGLPFILIFLIPAAIFFYLTWWVAALLCLLLAAFMAFFFRDPKRECLNDEHLILSPADGRVVMLTPVDPASSDSPVQMAIFLSPMDVHINRSPIAGEIIDVVYKPGAFHIASKDIATVEHEKNVIT